MRFSRIVAVGGYLPPKTLENAELERNAGFDSDWIYERTGILKRHISEESATEMGIKALRDAMMRSNISNEEIEYIFVVSNSTDTLIPGMAGRIQSSIAHPLGGVDVQAGCSGFLQAMEIADSMIKSGDFSTIAIVGTEKLSRIVNWKDLSIAGLFGDGAGAVVMKSSEKPGLIASYSRIQGEGWESLVQHRDSYLEMDGKTVFRFAVSAIEEAVNEVLRRSSLKIEDVDLIVPHQSNARIISRVSKDMGIPLEKFQVSIADHANTAAASVALALKDAIESKKIGESSVVLTVAYGAGLGIASNIFKL